MQNIDEKAVEELLTRSVAEILPSKEELKKKLLSGEKLRIYIGTDATGTSLHLGHATNYMILEKFRKLGHEVIFLIGDFTSRIGDPTDKLATRVSLTRSDVVRNVKTWIKQIKPIIKVGGLGNCAKVMYNHKWLSKLDFEDVLNLAANFTVQQMLERDMFENRMKDGKPIYLHEFLYPLMQGYDSVAMDVDIEMCGNDQKFNALAGRTLLRKLKNKEKFVFITTLLENPKTGEKMMSKSLGTGVYLDWSAEKMFGGVMAQPDENMQQLFTDTTHLTLPQIDEILKSKNPREAKLRLAYEIVKIYHGESAASRAQKDWEETFSKGGIPTEVEEISVASGTKLKTILVENKIVESNSEFVRLLSAGAIKNAETEEKIMADMEITENQILKVGKRRFVKIVIK